MLNITHKQYRIENFSIFITCIILYGFNTLIFSNINVYKLNYFFSSYFNDLLAPLLLFSYINLLLSLIDKKIYSLKYLILIIVLCSFVWEYLAIFLKPTSVPDPIDIIFYFLGTLLYWIIYKKWID
ncbi:MAG: hypothetical protein CVV28_03980 [Methanobacteriales archaeon HGW-Methanobacteriales-1]|jgi:phosphatidylserine synthase|nr:MAG: hypothetical protein CVV28_03980 [Methanobacteriales archaeon HGW-Methanobacteriales-1]